MILKIVLNLVFFGNSSQTLVFNLLQSIAAFI